MLVYDPSILVELATRLEHRARNLIALCVLVGCVLGWLVSFGQPVIGQLMHIFGGIVVGFLIGREIAFSLRVRAHTILCQVEIEKNTRKS